METASAKDLTIIVLTYERHRFLEKLIQFYVDYNYKILIVDGSENKFYNSDSLPPHITYESHANSSYSQRLKIAFSQCTSKYACLLPDDEFHLPSSLDFSIKLLEKYTKISTSIGLDVGFSLKAQNVVSGPFYNFKPKTFQNNLASRLEDFFLHYTPSVYYSVTRTSNLRNLLKSSLLTEYSSGNAFEWIFSFYLLACGIHHIHQYPHWLRHSSSSYIDLNRTRLVTLTDWLRQEKFEGERTSAFQHLEDLIAAISSHDDTYIKALIKYTASCSIFSASENKYQRILGVKPIKNYARKYTKTLEQYTSKFKKLPSTNNELKHIASIVSSIKRD